jgi:cytochrome P450
MLVEAVLSVWSGAKPLPGDLAGALLGDSSISITQDPELHTRLRQIMSPYFTPEAMQQLSPEIHTTVRKHLARWASESATGDVHGYNAAKLLTFDVIANHVLRLNMDEEEVKVQSKVFQTWTNGFLPPALDLPFLPFGKGLAAR